MNPTAKGVLLVLSGAISYGILATIVKYSNNLGMHTGVIVFMQYLVGAIVLSFLAGINQKREGNVMPSASAKLKLVMYGTSVGITSCLYYVSIQYVPVSVGIVLLMQSIWMGVVLEFILTRKPVSTLKIVAALITIFGTVLASDVLFQTGEVSWTGIMWGLAAAASYTLSLYASSTIEKNVHSYVRSQYLVIGGLLAVIVFWNTDITNNFNSINILISGVVLAIFGTILPPLLFTKGIPYIGLGLASILISVEIPISITSAQLVLGEQVSLTQWLGVVVIFISIVLANLKTISESSQKTPA
ncbi:drug/metabolite transporter (DMT)-like permease [Pedobacter sp. CAN_A7]|uniref:EamA family transporter n=1 Tax=Pedobacter sp. CAN_A7 TaxID=2787722 RepID=UPI0018CA8059